MVKSIAYNLFWHFQAGRVCRTSRVTEAMCFKTNNGSRFQNHKVALSVHISLVVCQAAALQNNHVDTLIYYPPYNNAQRPGELRVSCLTRDSPCPAELPVPPGCLQRGIWSAEPGESWDRRIGKVGAETKAVACFESHALPLARPSPKQEPPSPEGNRLTAFLHGAFCTCPLLQEHPARRARSLTPTESE